MGSRSTNPAPDAFDADTRKREAHSAADPEAVARAILLEALTKRACTRQELANKLGAKGVPDELASRLLDRFAEVGLVDDTAFARTWVESRVRSKGLARRALSYELRGKGVAEEVVLDVLADVDPETEEAAARGLVQRRLRSIQGLDRDKATRRLVGMLARKGYPPSLALSVVRNELAHAELPSAEGAADLQ